MALGGDEIRANLTRFAARWGIGEWGERKEAQTFLNELFDCFGMDRRDVAEFEHFKSGGFWDLVWPGVCLIEMKASSESGRLAQHRAQALGYWENAADEDKGVPAPEYVILCSFQRFEIWQPGRFPKGPRIAFDLAELPDRFEALLFLLGDEPLFDANRAAVTIEAVGKLAELFQSLDRRGEGAPTSSTCSSSNASGACSPRISTRSPTRRSRGSCEASSTARSARAATISVASSGS